MAAQEPRIDFTMIGIAAGAVLLGLAVGAVWLSAAPDEEESPFGEVVLDEEDLADFPPAEPAPRREAEAWPAQEEEAAAAPAPREEPAAEAALEPCPDAWRDPIRLFGDAQVRPVYEGRTFLAVSIRGVAPGSFWEELGIRSEDQVVELDGEPVDSPQASVDLMNALERSDRIRLRLRTKEGRDRWISWDAPPPPDPSTLPEHCR